MARTEYVIDIADPDAPRCRNTHTLAPLFCMKDPDGELVVDPVPLADVPRRFFWANSAGYGFDVRNLAVLLRVTFRNLNPHTVDTADPEPLWCTRADLSTLIYHPGIDDKVRETVRERVKYLNLLSDRSKMMLATAAHELYSATYQGFYDWVATMPGFAALVRGLGYRMTQRGVMAELEEVQRARRTATLRGIRSTLGTQAVEHRAEPAGIDRDTELYRLLEHYKAAIAAELIEYLEELSARRSRLKDAIEARLDEYAASRVSAITRRYARVHAKAARRERNPKLAARMRSRPSVLLWRAQFRSLMLSDVSCVLQVALLQKTGDFALTVAGETLVVADHGLVYGVIETILPQLLPPGPVELVWAAVAGGVAAHCKGRAWRARLRSDNRFLASRATHWALRAPFTSRVEQVIVDHGALRTASEPIRTEMVLRGLGARFADKMYRSIAERMAVSTPDIFEFDLLNRLQLRAGYDDFRGTLLDKLRAALDQRTCIQDVGGELCERLSVPYAPADRELYELFQCDHTSIPPEITPRAPASMLPATSLGDDDDGPIEITLRLEGLSLSDDELDTDV